MKNNDTALDRLLRSASHASPQAMDAEVPFGFTTRVVSGWLTGSAGDIAGMQVLWFRRSLVAAVAVMALSVGWCFKTDTSAPNDEMAIASYATTADLQ
jgi:hypothetical protein